MAERSWAELDRAALPRPDLSAIGRDWGDAFSEWKDAVALILTLMGA